MADRYWVGGNGIWDDNVGSKWAATSGGAGGASIPTSSDDVYFNASSGASLVQIATFSAACRNLNCTGFTGVLRSAENQPGQSPIPLTVFQDITLGATMGTNPVSANPFGGGVTADRPGGVFGRLNLVSSNIHVITSNGIPFSWASSFGTTILDTGTVQLADNLVTPNAFNISNATTLDLNNNTFTITSDTSSRLNVGSSANIAFGSSGALVIKRRNLFGQGGLNFASPFFALFTGSKNIIVDVAVGTFSPIFAAPANPNTLSYAFNYISAATNAARFDMQFADSIDWSLGTGSLELAVSSVSIYGNFTTYNGMPAITKASSGLFSVTFVAFSGTKTINCDSTWTDIGITFVPSDSSVVYNLGSNITQTNNVGSVFRWIPAVAATFNTNNFSITTSGFLASGGTCNLGTSTISSYGSSFFSPTAIAIVGTGADASNATFRSIGSGGSFSAVSGATIGALQLSSASNVTISSSSTNITINTLSNTVSPAAITFTSGNTTFFNNFNLSGTAGNLVTIRSTTNGTQSNLSKASGTVTVTYVDLRDSNAIGGAVWDARGPTNVIGTNVTGWLVSVQFVAVTEAITAADNIAVSQTTNVNITEILETADTANEIRIFNVTSNEAITSADIEASTIVTFVTAISEGLTVADTPTGFGIYPISISENITLADIEAAVKIHNATAAEPISVLDVTSCFGFGTIDNSQSTTWTLIDNRQ